MERANFDDVSEADLKGLCEAGTPEGLTLEYKRDPYGGSDKDRHEALKDLTSFANSAGGHLIIGMETDRGIATNPVGVPRADVDALKNRLEALLRDGVEPRVVGHRMREIELSNGAAAVVVRIPRSWNPPHRVSANKSNRFYVRNSGGVHEASVEELRMLFTLAADLQTRIKQFRSERIQAIKYGLGSFPLPVDVRRIVHLAPLSAFARPVQIDLEQVQGLGGQFAPMGRTSGFSPHINIDGFANARPGDPCEAYTQVFRNGIVEAAYGTEAIISPQGAKYLSGEDTTEDIVRQLPLYLDGLKSLGVEPPIVVMVSYTGTTGVRLGLMSRHGWTERTSPFPNRDPLVLPEVIIDDYGHRDGYVTALRPIFDALWNGAGFARCDFFDAAGAWRRK